MKKHDFNESLEKGLEYEEEFKKNFYLKIHKNTEIKGTDFFAIQWVGRIKRIIWIELKTDLRAEDTGNFFIERFSDILRETNGGPWQALAKGAKYIIYYLPKKKEFFIFDCYELAEYMESYIDTLNPREIVIPNNSHSSMGYAVPIEVLKKIAVSIPLGLLNSAVNTMLANLDVINGANPQEIETVKTILDRKIREEDF